MPPVPQGTFSLWVEEMKLPPLDAEAMQRSAAFVPMTSMQWQEKQDPENMELQPDDHKFRWDGRFVANPNVTGHWQVIHQLQ